MKHFRISVIALLILVSYRVFSQQPPALIPYRDGDRWGYADAAGRIVVPLQYDEAWPFTTRPEMFAPGYNPEYLIEGWPELEHPVALVKKDGLFGLLDAGGKELTPPVSPAPFFFAWAGIAYTLRYNAGDMDENENTTMRLAVLTASGQHLTPFRYDFGYDDDYGDGWGDSDMYGHSSFYNFFPQKREAVVVRKGERFGLVSAITGEELNAPVWNSILPGDKGISIAYGMDSLPLKGFSGEGNYLIGPGNRILRKLDGVNYAARYSCGLFAVGDQYGYTGFINTRGESVIPVSLAESYGFSDDGVAKVRTADGAWQIIDTTGAVKMTLGPEGGCWKRDDGYFILESDGLWYRYDRSFRKTTPTGFNFPPQPVDLCGKRYYYLHTNESTGLVDTAGTVVLSADYYIRQYEPAEQYDRYGHLIPVKNLYIKKGELSGIMDCEFREIVPLIYDDVRFYEPGRWLVERQGKSGIFDSRQKKMLLPVRFDEIRYNLESASPYFSVREGKYWGKYDTSGREILPPVFKQDFFGRRGDPYLLVESARGWHVFDQDVEISFLKNIFTDTMPSLHNYSRSGGPDMVAIMAKVNGKPALFDLHGNTLIPPDYDFFQVEKDHAFVKTGNQWGAITFPGLDEIVPTLYKHVQYDNGKYRLYESDRKEFTLYDPATGSRRVVPVKYTYMATFSEGAAVVHRDCIFGYVNEDFREIVPLTFAGASTFSGGLAMVKTPEGLYGYIKHDGTFAIPPRFQRAENFVQGTAAVQYLRSTDSVLMFALIDRSGSELLSFPVEEGSGLYKVGNYILVQENNTRQYVLDSSLNKVLDHCSCLRSHDGKEVAIRFYCNDRAGILTYDGRILPDDAGYFYAKHPGGFVELRYCNIWGVRDSTGRWVIPMDVQYGNMAGNGEYFSVTRSSGMGLFDLSGKELLPFEYSAVEPNGTYLRTYKDNLQGLCAGDGRLIVPAEYAEVEPFPGIGLIKVTDTAGRVGFYDFSGRKYFR